MYRDVANATGHDLHFHTGRALAEALGYPTDLLDRLRAQAVSSFAGVGYHLALAYRFASDRTQRTSDKYSAQTIELLAIKPTQETSK